MNREEHLEYCQVCAKREFSMKKGLICSLTGEWADFDPLCDNYEPDQKAFDSRAVKRALLAEEQLASDTSGLSRFGIKNGIVAGIILIIIAIAWFVVGIVSLNRIFLYPFGLVVLGIIAIIKGFGHTKKYLDKKQKSVTDAEILDVD